MNHFISLRVMKAIGLLLLWGSTLVLSAQEARVSVSFHRIPLKQALAELQAKSGYNFLYNSKLVDDSRPVSLEKENTELGSILDELFAGTAVRYSVDNKQIVLYVASADDGRAAAGESSLPPAVSTPVAAQPQNVLPPRAISGTITDEAGEPLPGTVVSLKDRPGRYDIADTDGRFALNDVAESAVLVINCIGYEVQEQPVGRRNTIAVSLKQVVTQLADVVVTGYQTLSKERATGAFNVIKSDALEKSLSSDLSTALLGTTAGMQGKENADGSIDFTIRGVGTLHADQTPLVVVDGFPVANGFKDINPNDVENVTVLKDAAAASIWGARSGNGVIVITTKKPKEAGKLQVEVNALVRVGRKMDLSSVLTTASSADQVKFERYYMENGWQSNPYTGVFADINASLSMVQEYMYAQKFGTITTEEMNAALGRLSRTNNRGQLKEHLLQYPVLQQYNLAISQASERSRNYLSVLYENQTGNVVKNGNNRWKLNFNNQSTVFRWLDFTISANLHYATQNTSGPTVGEMAGLSPYEMLLNEDDSYAEQIKDYNREQLAKIPAGAMPYDDWSYNLLREVRGRELTGENLNARIAAGLTFKLLPELTYTSNFQYEYSRSETNNYYGEDTYFTRNLVNQWTDYTEGAARVSTQYIPGGGILESADAHAGNYTWRNQFNYNRTFDEKHNITALAGMEITENRSDGTAYPWVFGYDPDKNTSTPLTYAQSQIGSFIATGGPSSSFPLSRVSTLFSYRNDRYVSVYGNVAYSFDSKYNLTASVRSDASNMIADDPSYRWSPLWSVGGMWHAHRETFMRGTASWLNRLTARLTFGYNGNVDKSTSPYTLLSVSPIPDLNTGTFVHSIAAMGNPTLRWERTHTLNFGVDFSAFHNVLFGSIDLYNKEGKDIIGNISLPSVTGTTSKKLNVAGIYNRGVEMEVGVNAAITEAIGVTTKLTYAYNKNKITRLFRTNVLSADMLRGDYMEGYPVGALWAYDWLGMNSGKAYVAGVDGQPFSIHDGSLHNSVAGLDVLQYMGPSVDPHTLGWTGAVSGYGLSLSFTVTGKFGGHFRNPAFQNYMQMDNRKNIVPLFIAEVLKGSKDQPSLPVSGSQATDFNTWGNYVGYLDTMVESSSFVKLKEITLEYNLPKRWMDTAGLERVKVYGQVRDLGCLWVANSRGYDPEWLPGAYKPVTTCALGVNINF